MSIVQLTGWRLDYIMDEISIGALNVLFGSSTENTDKPDKPTGMLADPNFDMSKLKKMTGLNYRKE